jgi:hypothetical protein
MSIQMQSLPAPLRQAVRSARLASANWERPGGDGADTDDRARVFADDLRRLHDILAPTALASRYWVWGGLLLGWAREGRLMAHDLFDADFGFLAEDLGHFEDGARALIAGGFQPMARFRNHAGTATEYTFLRNGAKFEFFVHTRTASGRLEYYLYNDGREPGSTPTEARAEIAAQRLTSFRFLRRRWLKHADHAAEMVELYDDWLTPDPDWYYMNECSIVERRRWEDPHPHWTGSLPGDSEAR